MTDAVPAGVRAGAVLMASIPPRDANPDIIPQSERLDLPGVYQRAQRGERGAQLLALLADAQHKGPQMSPKDL